MSLGFQFIAVVVTSLLKLIAVNSFRLGVLTIIYRHQPAINIHIINRGTVNISIEFVRAATPERPSTGRGVIVV